MDAANNSSPSNLANLTIKLKFADIAENSSPDQNNKLVFLNLSP